jgi:hypothetical protein
MKQSLFWKITHWLGGGNIGAAQRAFRKRQRAYLDAHKKDKMSCEYMATLELDDLLDIQSKHSEGTPIYLRVQFELQRRFNLVDNYSNSAWCSYGGNRHNFFTIFNYFFTKV